MLFIDGFSTIAGFLNKLRKQGVEFKWTPKRQKAFEELKHYLANGPLLFHYDEKLPLALSIDASPYGIGAVLFHIDGKERPIAFASRTLSDAEKRYGQKEREGAAIIFGVIHFEKYLYGRRFNLYTDHDL